MAITDIIHTKDPSDMTDIQLLEATRTLAELVRLCKEHENLHAFWASKRRTVLAEIAYRKGGSNG